METTGLLKEVFDTQKVSDKFQKRDFVLTTEASTPYPQNISFQLTQDKCSILDSFQKGEEINPERLDVLASGAVKTLLPNGETKYLLQEYMDVTVGDVLSVDKVLGFERGNHYMMWVYLLTDNGLEYVYSKTIPEIVEGLRKVRNSVKE